MTQPRTVRKTRRGVIVRFTDAEVGALHAQLSVTLNSMTRDEVRQWHDAKQAAALYRAAEKVSAAVGLEDTESSTPQPPPAPR